MKEVDLLYNDYIRVMTCMHEKLRNQYNTYVTKFLDENARRENCIEPETQRLILPGEEEDLSKMFEQSKPSMEEEEKDERSQGQAMPASQTVGNGNQNLASRPYDEHAVNESQYNIDETNESFSERKN